MTNATSADSHSSGFIGRTLGVPLPVRTHAELFFTRTRPFSKNRPKLLLQGCVDAYALRDRDQWGNELPLGLTEVTGVTCWSRRHDELRR